MNAARLALLGEIEATAGPLDVEKVLEAFLAPTAEMAQHNPTFVRLMGRMLVEGMMPRIVEAFQESAARFVAALEAGAAAFGAEELLAGALYDRRDGPHADRPTPHEYGGLEHGSSDAGAAAGEVFGGGVSCARRVGKMTRRRGARRPDAEGGEQKRCVDGYAGGGARGGAITTGV